MTIEAAPKRSAWSAIAVYGERRALVMLALGFASGLPNLLIFDTLSAWLRDAGLSLEVIAFFSLATLAVDDEVHSARKNQGMPLVVPPHPHPK